MGERGAMASSIGLKSMQNTPFLHDFVNSKLPPFFEADLSSKTENSPPPIEIGTRIR